MTRETEAAPIPTIARIGPGDLARALAAGGRDFVRAPLFGLFFSAFYVIAGIGLVLAGAGTIEWTLVLSLGFPLVAPFAAVGLYEVSRRLETGEPRGWRDILGVVWRERGRQTPWIGAILVLVFLFWSFFAHMSFALFLGHMPMTNISTSWETLMTTNGLSMIAFQILVGLGVTYLVFSLTVVSLPLLLDREVDFVTAMLTSMRTVARNQATLLLWAALIAVLLFIAMSPLFLGLLLALPVLGHATWHLYRRLILFPA
ncbi:DUF2189 domain-containing protein [Acuticoccus sp. M5D2P5]|uniref:DUF2189 domain-containing protein n=1 Tax=Acuticoccus kalidii TaxID=2910977 RepID=UPI001F42E3BD|nr:DUF2189 domain-containing protein [Acuticoccus kalidii]MCF3931983.1 DUF2189 domain-containing protein [Acuticoccus kalidii]